MAIIPLAPDNFEVFTLELHPRKQYSSGSLGITGSVNLFAERSTTQRLLENSKTTTEGLEQGWGKDQLIIELNDLKYQATLTDNMEVGLESYLAAVNSQPAQLGLNRAFDVQREKPSETYTEIITGSIKKQQIKKLLLVTP